MRKAKNFCKSCGGCCGPVPITTKEKEIILLYMKNNNINPTKKSDLDCKFLDENKRCSIYPVRPSVCKLFGGYINLRCPNYNGKYKDPIRPKEMPVARLNDLEIEQVRGLTNDLCFFDEADYVAKEKLYTPSHYDYRFKDLRIPKPISPDKGKKGKNCNVTACQLKDSAFYYNKYSKAYYCEECALEINTSNREEICIKIDDMSSCTECQKIFKYADWGWTKKDGDGKIEKNKVCLVGGVYDLDEIVGDSEDILRGEALCPHCGSEDVFATTEKDIDNGFDVKESGDNDE